MMKSQKLLIVSLMLLLWPLQAARAAVVATALPEPLNLHDDWFGTYKPIDVDGNGSVDFTFAYSLGGVSLRTERSNRHVIRLIGAPTIGGRVEAFDTNAIIGADLFQTDGHIREWASADYLGGYVSPDELVFDTIVSVFSTGSASNFHGRGLIGVEFESELGTHYGYIDIEAGPGYAGITLYGWAYETEPGVPITAAFVPEPGVSLLALGAAGGLLARRPRPSWNR